MKGDTPAHRVNVMEMDDNTLDAFLLNIRDRRLHSVRIFEESEQLRELARRQKMTKVLDHEQAMCKKELTQLDKVIDKVEKRVLKLRALRLQLED